MTPLFLTRESRGFTRLRLIFSAMILVTFYHAFTLSFFSDRNSRRQLRVIPGWEPYRSRMAEVYVKPNESTVIIDGGGSSLCPTPLLLLIVVCSNPINHHLRAAIRSTWASAKDQAVKVVFLLGYNRNDSIQNAIIKESESWKDIIQENFLDTYFNLTIKSIMMLKWFTTYCKQAKFLLKTDDDIFLKIEVFKNSLRQPFPPGIDRETLLGGYLVKNAVPIAEINDKWFMPSHLYPGDTYPDYLSGTCYLMSRQVAESLYSTAMKVKMIHMEDVYLTGQIFATATYGIKIVNNFRVERTICYRSFLPRLQDLATQQRLCAQAAEIKQISMAGMTLTNDVSLACGGSYIMMHKVTPDEMFDLWRTYSSCSDTSEESIFLDNIRIWKKIKMKFIDSASYIRKYFLQK